MMNVGFIGLGNMGKHMARHIGEAGYPLYVHDIRKEAGAPFIKNGGTWLDTPGEMASRCEVIVSSLPGPPQVDEVVNGKDGLVSGWKKGDIFIDMSTNSPIAIRRIAEKAGNMGVEVLDAPVSGGVPGAEGARLTIIVGGKKETLELVRGILQTMGKNIFHVGEAGCGNIAKLVNNMIALACNAINAEGFVLGVKAGIDPITLLEILKISTGNNHSLQQFPKVLGGNFDPGFKLNLAHKDIKLALDLGKEYHVPLPVSTTVERQIFEAEAAGLGEKSIQATIFQLEESAGVQVRTAKIFSQ